MSKTIFFNLLGIGLLVAASVACGESSPPPATPSATAATSADADGDGVSDNVDKCLDKKEDGLGAEPKDGCPNPTKP